MILVRLSGVLDHTDVDAIDASLDALGYDAVVEVALEDPCDPVEAACVELVVDGGLDGSAPSLISAALARVDRHERLFVLTVRSLDGGGGLGLRIDGDLSDEEIARIGDIEPPAVGASSYFYDRIQRRWRTREAEPVAD